MKQEINPLYVRNAKSGSTLSVYPAVHHQHDNTVYYTYVHVHVSTVCCSAIAVVTVFIYSTVMHLTTIGLLLLLSHNHALVKISLLRFPRLFGSQDLRREQRTCHHSEGPEEPAGYQTKRTIYQLNYGKPAVCTHVETTPPPFTFSLFCLMDCCSFLAKCLLIFGRA